MDFDDLWQKYHTSLKRFLSSKISNKADVDDIFQDVLIKTFINLPGVKDHTNIKSWLYQVANNTIIDFYRKNAREQNIPVEDMDLTKEPASIKEELSDCIAPFIKALPKEQSELLANIDLQGKSQKEYANELGVSYSTLKSRVQKSRNDLKKVFDECCHFIRDKDGSIYDYSKKNDQCDKC